MFIQELLNFNRCFAAHCCCCDCLTIEGVSYIACCEDSFYISARCLALCFKITNLVHL